MSSLDYGLLRTSHPSQTGPYLHKIALDNQVGPVAVSQELLNAVHSQSLPPRVYELWLCACPDATAIILGLQQSKSVLVRRGAIKAFKRWFRTSKCVDIWRAVGGTDGIVAMLVDFSVNHVSEFCKQLGKCSTSSALRPERQNLVTELMYSLASRFFPGSAKVQNPDERPLWNVYAQLVYACTPQARDAWIDHKDLPELSMMKVMQTDTEHYQQQCLDNAAAGDKNLHRYAALFVSLPPKVSVEDPTVTQSMEFAASFLETLSEHDVQLPKEGGYRKLGSAFMTVIRRLACRRISREFVLETVTLISSCLKQQVIDAANHGGASKFGDYMKDIARLWALDPDTFEGPLSELLGEDINKLNYRHLAPVVSIVARKDRFRLLQWLIFTQYKVDIDDSSQLPSLRRGVSWDLLTALPNAEAQGLLDRLVTIEGDRWISVPGVQLPDVDRANVKLEMLRCRFIDDDASRVKEASLKTAEYQRIAQKERDAQSRMKWVTATGLMAVESGSIDLLKDVLVWARRYNRDPMVSQFYGSNSPLRRPDTISLLSGIPERPTQATTRDVVKGNICKGNDVVLLLWETAAMCQNEPSFYATHWSEVQHLFADIVQARIQRIKKLKTRLNLSNDETINLVWEPTIHALLDAEELGIDERNKALQFDDMNGPLDIWGDVVATDPDPTVLWFIDELARRRDALWQQQRCKMHTNVMTLEAPWPRGLPVQALLSVYRDGKVSGEGLPFITECARNVVFMPAEKALRELPESKEDRAAIGSFVEDYQIALKIFVSSSSKKERPSKAHAAWQHATRDLSEARLSPREAMLYWTDIFDGADVPCPASTLALPLRQLPSLPDIDDLDHKAEWHPDAGPHPTVKDRTLAPTCLDCFTHPSITKSIHAEFLVPTPSVSRTYIPKFWYFSRLGSGVPFQAKDAFIAAGLLLIDAISQADSKVLSNAFPGGAPRFPAVFLDSEFVEDQRAFNTYPVELLNDTPAALLEQLTAALIEKLCTSEKPAPTLVKWTFTTLSLLAWSDNPELSIRHIVRVIIDLPDHSSWHRVMLHPGILKRLTATQSKALVAGLADAINEKSAQRKWADTVAKSTPAEPSSDAKPPSTPFVKVTTVKLLAQLMSHAEFIGESFTVDILVKLFAEATHVDIRAAVVESLVAIAELTKSSSIKENVMTVLETHVVPFAAELSERSPMTEQAWKECEEKLELPDIETQKPSQDALLDFINRSTWQRDPAKTRALIQSLLLPMIHKSASNGQRWLKIALSARGATELCQYVPKAFGTYGLLKDLLRKYPAHMPASCYDDLHALLVFFAEASGQYKDLKACFEAMNPPPVGHEAWLRITSKDSSDPDPDTAGLLKTSIFATSEDAAANGLLTPSQLQNHEKKMIDICLSRFDQDAKSWEGLTSRHLPPLRQKEAWQVAWYGYCRPLVEYMVSRIDATRTPKWLHDPERKPARLPDAFQLRLWLLTYPSMPWRGDAEQELRRDKFVREVRALIMQLADSGRPYHARFELVVAAAKKCYEKDYAFIAWQLGLLSEKQIGGDLDTAKLLLVELADSLLKSAQAPVTHVVMDGVKEMLAGWKKCVDEDVRDRGIVTTALLESNKMKKDALPW